MFDPRFDAFDRRRWQAGFGRDLSGIVVRDDERSAALASAHDAHAVARDGEVFLGDVRGGEQHGASRELTAEVVAAHELAHALGARTEQGAELAGAQARARVHGRGGPVRGLGGGGHGPVGSLALHACRRGLSDAQKALDGLIPFTPDLARAALTEYRALSDADRQKAVDRYYPSGGFTRLMAALPAADASGPFNDVVQDVLRRVQRSAAATSAKASGLANEAAMPGAQSCAMGDFLYFSYEEDRVFEVYGVDESTCLSSQAIAEYGDLDMQSELVEPGDEATILPESLLKREIENPVAEHELKIAMKQFGQPRTLSDRVGAYLPILLHPLKSLNQLGPKALIQDYRGEESYLLPRYQNLLEETVRFYRATGTTPTFGVISSNDVPSESDALQILRRFEERKQWPEANSNDVNVIDTMFGDSRQSFAEERVVLGSFAIIGVKLDPDIAVVTPRGSKLVSAPPGGAHFKLTVTDQFGVNEHDKGDIRLLHDWGITSSKSVVLGEFYGSVDAAGKIRLVPWINR